VLTTVLLYFVLALLLVEWISGSAAVTIIVFIAFLLRNLYFIHFKLSTQGVDARKAHRQSAGHRSPRGPFVAGAIVARNLTREVEIFSAVRAIFDVASSGGGLEFLGRRGLFRLVSPDIGAAVLQILVQRDAAAAARWKRRTPARFHRSENFALFSANGTKVEVCLFDSTGERETARIVLRPVCRTSDRLPTPFDSRKQMDSI
jgi:hypothetical protein